MVTKVIAVDPGREKCGLAVIHKNEGVLYKAVVEIARLRDTVSKLIKAHGITTIIVGNGTACSGVHTILKTIETEGRVPELVVVDERHSTEEARRLYWRENPPRGLMRLIPVTMQVPPAPVDDYVAVILAERYFKNCH